MLALKAKPSTAATAASTNRRCRSGPSSAPIAPQAAQPSICWGVQIPWPRKKFEASAASAPVPMPGAQAERRTGDDRRHGHRLHAGHRGEEDAARGGRGAERRDQRQLARRVGARLEPRDARR